MLRYCEHEEQLSCDFKYLLSTMGVSKESIGGCLILREIDFL